ncbi:MAG: sugar-binding protein [bacterium]|nr:sugar-binding protein [bacterium]
MMKQKIAIGFACLALLGWIGLPAGAENLVYDGSFEEQAPAETWPHYGDVFGWEFSGGKGLNDKSGPFWDNADESQVNGKQVLFAQNPQIFYQDIEGFQQGKEYTLRFLERVRNCCGSPLPPLHLIVRIEGEEMVPEHKVPVEAFVPYEIDFVAVRDGFQTLEFEIIAPEGGDVTLLLDAVSIVPKGEANPYPTPPPVAPKSWPITAMFTTTPPTIDGVLNVATEYANAQVVDLRKSTLDAQDPYDPTATHGGTLLPTAATAGVTDDNDLSALIYFLWDNTGLYVAVDAKDEEMIVFENPCGTYDCSAGGVNQGDTFQLCIDYDSVKATDGQQAGTKVFIPSWALTTNADDVKYFQQFWPVSDPNPMTGIKYNMKTKAGGYVLEAMIPWSAFTAGGETFTKPFPPVDGQVCGLLPMLEDQDPATGAGVTFMYTAGDGGNIIANASKYSVMTFKKVTTPTQNWILY